MRVRWDHFVAGLAGTALTLLPVPVTAATSYPIAVQDTTAATTRSVQAYLGSDQVAVPIFSISFTTTVSGEKRGISGKVIANQASNASDPLLLAAVNVSCAAGSTYSTSDPHAKLSNAQNILRGTTITLAPRFIFTAGIPGQYTCGLTANSGRPRPGSSIDPDLTDRYTIQPGSYLQATVPIHPSSAQGYLTTTPSPLLTNAGDAYDAAVLYWTAPAGVTSFSMTGDLKMTTCTAVAGSRDSTTNGTNLCDGYKVESPFGSTVASVLVAYQINDEDGTYCATNRYPATGFTITNVSKDVHHKMVYFAATIPVSTARGCGRTFRVKIYVILQRGNTSYPVVPVMVHNPNTITTAIP
jgi:hypothetical protein